MAGRCSSTLPTVTWKKCLNEFKILIGRKIVCKRKGGNMAIILASQSPRRKELLRYLVTDFLIEPADVDETIQPSDEPEDYVMRMAQAKAAKIAAHHPADIVIACDTIVVNQGEILGKPVDRKDGYRMLRALSGGVHQVFTALVIRQGGQITTALVPAEVTFFELTDEEIQNYLESGEYADKAGAYGIQGGASLFVKQIVGDYYSIVGFPVGVVNQLLKKFKS